MLILELEWLCFYYLESGVGSESEHEGSGSKGEDDSDCENNTPSPPYVVPPMGTTLTNSHNGQSSCNTVVRQIIKYLIWIIKNTFLNYKYLFTLT